MNVYGLHKTSNAVLAFAFVLVAANGASLHAVERVPLTVLNAQPMVAKNELILLHSDKPLSDEQTRWILETIEQAYRFDLKQLGWDARRPEFSKPFHVVVISRSMLADHHWTLGGSTHGDYGFAINGRCFDDQKPYYIGVIAHELTHLLVNRASAGVDLRKLQWYPMMGEGLAIENGMRFRILNEPELYPDHRLPANKQLEAITGETVRKNFANAADTAAHHDSDIGLLFIEFLKGLKTPDNSERDVQRRLGSVLLAMCRENATYPTAFKTEFGIELESAQNDFAEHIGRTEADPESRLAGTILMPRAKYKPAG